MAKSANGGHRGVKAKPKAVKSTKQVAGPTKINAARYQIITKSTATIFTGLQNFFSGIDAQAVLTFLAAVFSFVTAFVGAIRENRQQDGGKKKQRGPRKTTGKKDNTVKEHNEEDAASNDDSPPTSTHSLPTAQATNQQPFDEIPAAGEALATLPVENTTVPTPVATFATIESGPAQPVKKPSKEAQQAEKKAAKKAARKAKKVKQLATPTVDTPAAKHPKVVSNAVKKQEAPAAKVFEATKVAQAPKTNKEESPATIKTPEIAVSEAWDESFITEVKTPEEEFAVPKHVARKAAKYQTWKANEPLRIAREKAEKEAAEALKKARAAKEKEMAENGGKPLATSNKFKGGKSQSKQDKKGKFYRKAAPIEIVDLICLECLPFAQYYPNRVALNEHKSKKHSAVPAEAEPVIGGDFSVSEPEVTVQTVAAEAEPAIECDIYNLEPEVEVETVAKKEIAVVTQEVQETNSEGSIEDDGEDRITTASRKEAESEIDVEEDDQVETTAILEEQEQPALDDAVVDDVKADSQVETTATLEEQEQPALDDAIVDDIKADAQVETTAILEEQEQPATDDVVVDNVEDEPAPRPDLARESSWADEVIEEHAERPSSSSAVETITPLTEPEPSPCSGIKFGALETQFITSPLVVDGSGSGNWRRSHSC